MGAAGCWSDPTPCDAYLAIVPPSGCVPPPTRDESEALQDSRQRGMHLAPWGTMANQTSQPRALNLAAAVERRGGPAGFAERRHRGRVPATLQTQIKSAAQVDFEEAYTTDVSDSGAFIRITVPMVRG